MPSNRCADLGHNYMTIRKQKEPEIVKMYTFSSARKRMSVVLPDPSGKGGPDFVHALAHVS